MDGAMNPPPNDLALERTLLGCLLTDGVPLRIPPRAFFYPECKWIAAHLTEEDRPAHSAEYRAARACLFLSIVSGASPECFLENFEGLGVLDMMRAYRNVSASWSLADAEARIVELWRLRRAEDWMRGICASIRSGEMSLDDVFDEIRRVRE